METRIGGGHGGRGGRIEGVRWGWGRGSGFGIGAEVRSGGMEVGLEVGLGVWGVGNGWAGPIELGKHNKVEKSWRTQTGKRG